MRTIVKADPLVAEQLVSDTVRADYVYMYPPRQAYRPVSEQVLGRAFAHSLSRSGPLNLYVHVPFCRQICAFCNLFAVAGAPSTEHARYIDTVCSEIGAYAPLIHGRPIDTIYIGGGTPSMLEPNLIAKLMDCIGSVCAVAPSEIPEVAIEVAPDTVTSHRLAALRRAGINRINLGVQSLTSSELSVIGRAHGAETAERALQTALDAGFGNVCVDLIYGLQGQSDQSWEHSVRSVVSCRPQTICCYPLTLRPRTGFARRGYHQVDDGAQYRRYDLAHRILTDAGYLQETHVRWVVPRVGGYRQKSNHWAGQDILGVGAGARSYLHLCDARNGYSVRHRANALRSYYCRVGECGHGRTDGFLMDEDERRRKDVILGLGHLDRAQYHARHGFDVLDIFSEELQSLLRIDAVTVADHAIALTSIGQRHRDVLVQMFFSNRVKALISGHDYNE